MTTGTEVISYEEILSDLQAIVEEFGADYVYVKPSGSTAKQGCLYSHGDKPGCIVGQVLARHGVPLSDLEQLDRPNAYTYSAAVGPLVEAGAFPITVDERAVNLLERVQVHQDNGKSWGEALRRAQD